MTHRDNVLLELPGMIPEGVGKTVLEIGQGQDRQIREMLMSKGYKYFGADPFIGVNNDWDGLINSSEEYVSDYMEDLRSFKDNSIDLVVICHAFEHCERPIDALREINRVLVPGGMLINITPWSCKHHILDADPDHIMVLNSLQITRMLIYTSFVGIGVFEQKKYEWKEQDWNIFSVGTKVLLTEEGS